MAFARPRVQNEKPIEVSPFMQPLHIVHGEREPAFSYMSRMAAVGGISARDLGLDTGIPFLKIIDGDPEAIERLANLGNVPAAQIAAWTPRKIGSARRRFRHETLPSRTLLTPELRGCPECLRQDARDSDLPPHRSMTIRAEWLVPHVTLCLEHGQPLVPLWSESTPIARYDTARRFSEVTADIMTGGRDVTGRDPTDFDEWLDRRLVHGAQRTWLDEHPLNAAANFCRMLGVSLLKHEGFPMSHVQSSSNWAFYQIGFEVAREGEGAIREALKGLNRLVEPRQGPKAAFPMLYDRLAHDYRDDPDYAPFRRILGSHLLETWPLGAGDEILGEPVLTRRLHSVKTASEETGVDPRRLRKSLQAAGLIDGTFPDAWSVFSAETAHDILAPLVELVSAKAFAAGLEMSRSQFDLLVEDGILQPALSDTDTNFVWDLRDGRAFLDRLLVGAQVLNQAQHGWEHIARTAQRLKVRPGEIIRAIEDGRILRVGNNVQFSGYRAVHVYHEEVAQALLTEEAPGLTLELFAKAVGLAQPSHLMRLVRNGHTPATERRNPRTKALQRHMTRDDAEAFHARFVTLRTLAKARNTTWQKASAALRAAGVTPFSPDGTN